MSSTMCVSILAAVLLTAQNGTLPVTGSDATPKSPPASAKSLEAPQSGFVRKVREPAEVATPVTNSNPAPPSPVSGDTVVDLGSGIRIDLAFIPPGEFRMGSDDGQADEFPVRRVVINRGFLIGKYEVTQAQWVAVMGSNPAAFTGEGALPVDRVSWEDCQEFIRRLNDLTGGGWRLPTEAEWEYACRAGTNGEYAGDVDSFGWHRENSGQRPHPAGSKRPNRWGLYDTHGNVWEWCEDWYDPSAYGRTNGTERVGPRSGVFRVTRGGSWYDAAVSTRSANRNGTKPTARSVTLGLRLVRASP